MKQIADYNFVWKHNFFFHNELVFFFRTYKTLHIRICGSHKYLSYPGSNPRHVADSQGILLIYSTPLSLQLGFKLNSNKQNTRYHIHIFVAVQRLPGKVQRAQGVYSPRRNISVTDTCAFTLHRSTQEEWS